MTLISITDKKLTRRCVSCESTSAISLDECVLGLPREDTILLPPCSCGSAGILYVSQTPSAELIKDKSERGIQNVLTRYLGHALQKRGRVGVTYMAQEAIDLPEKRSAAS